MRKYICRLCFLLCFALHVNANTKALVSVDSLNVRSNPNGEKIDSIPKDTSVLIVEEKGEWSKISYGENTLGWVSSKFITEFLKDDNQTTSLQKEIESKISFTTCKDENTTGKNVCITVDKAELKCSDSDCEVVFDYTIKTDYEGTGLVYAELDFKASIELPNKQIIERLKQTGHNFYKKRTQSDQIKVHFYLEGPLKQSDIKIKDTKVIITDVKYYD